MNKNLWPLASLTLLCSFALASYSKPNPQLQPQLIAEAEHDDDKKGKAKDDDDKKGKAKDDDDDKKGKAKDDNDDKKGKAKDDDDDKKGKAKDDDDDKKGKAEIHLTSAAIASNGVKLAQVQQKSLIRTLSSPARVAFNGEAVAHVGTLLRGRVKEWKVRLGSTVKKGDPLVIIDSPELGEAQSDYLLKLAAAKSTVASVNLAKSVWARSQDVFDKTRGITMTQVQQREAEYQAALIAQRGADEASLAAARKLQILGMDRAAVATLATGGELVSQFAVVAPLDGQIIQRDATLGELVGPERDNLLIVADLRQLWVLAEVPEAQVRDIELGAKAWLRLMDEPGTSTEGKITYISPVVDEATRTVKVRIEASGTKLHPGSFVGAQIATAGETAPVLAIPEDAIQELEGKSVVFVPVKGEADTFVVRPVTTGEAVGGEVPVTAGLALGESFVAAGSFILKAELLKASAKED